jgi:AcrR family transcriptional regulator
MSKLKNRRDARAASANPLYTDRKAAILEAAGKVFYRKGFLATKLSDIAEEANMDRASLYYYVGSKQDLFENIFSGAVTENINKARAIAKEDIPSLEKLAKMIESLMISFEEKYPFFYILVQEDLRKISQIGDPKNEKWLATNKKLSKEYFEVIKGIITQGIEDGEIRSSLPPGLIAHSIIGMINSSSNWFRPNGIMTAKEVGAGLAKMITEGLSTQ